MERTHFFVPLHSPEMYRSAFVFWPEAIWRKVPFASLDDRTRRQLVQLVSHYSSLFADRLYQSGKVAFDLFSLSDLGNSVGLGAGEKYSVIGMSVGHVFVAPEVLRDIGRAVRSMGKSLGDDMVRDQERILSGNRFEGKEDGQAASPAGW